MAGTLRVALLGAGYIADYHARGVLAHPGATLVAAANWRPESLEALAERHVIAHVTTDWRELVADEDIDAVVIATPNVFHAEQSIAFLEAGKHVMVEKPMAMNAAEGEAMIAASHASGASLMVAHCWRFHPDVLALRDRIASGELGTVVKTRGYGVHAHWMPRGWFVQPELAGGGALADMGVHAIDTARFLLGGPLPGRVDAVVGTRYTEQRVDDDAILLIRWDNGTNSLVESGWQQPHAAGLEADTEIYATGGYARVFAFTEAPSEDYEHCPQSMYTAQIAEFVDAITDGRQPLPSGEDGLVVMQVVDAAYAAAGARG
jgi:predicted dehydrogenase